MATPPHPRPPLRLTRRGRVVVGGAAVVIVLLLVWAVGRLSGGSEPSATPRHSTTTTASTPPTTARALSGREPTPPPAGIIASPDVLDVLVDAERQLPPGWVPPQLTVPDVRWAFVGQHPKQQLRPEAASALEGLFAAAAEAGLPLSAVSGYRDERSQADLFDAAAAELGEEQAARINARPGHSEHQTGLAMDVTGADGACAAEACFAERPEAAWLVDHAHRFGFIIRYPQGAEHLTGITWEPWHLRFVGVELATELTARGQTLEEHFGVTGS